MSYLKHYGTPRHSGRYPWGSGKNPQRNRSFLQRADELTAQGLSKKEIANAFGLSTGDYVAMRKIYKNQVHSADVTFLGLDIIRDLVRLVTVFAFFEHRLAFPVVCQAVIRSEEGRN